VPFVPSLRSHYKRRALVLPGMDGRVRVPGAFCPILAKGTSVAETTEYRESFGYFGPGPGPRPDEECEFEIIAYRGQGEPPEFIDDEPGTIPPLPHPYSFAR